MLIGSFTPQNNSVLSKIVTRSCKTLLIELTYKNPSNSPFLTDNTRIRVDLQNNTKGLLSPVIPSVLLHRLAEISSRKEGSVNGIAKSEGADNFTIVTYPISLTQAGNFDLNSEKFLEINITELPNIVSQVRVFAYDVDMVSALRFQYNKMNIPTGVAREKFVLGSNDLIALPIEGYEEVQLTFPSGMTSRLSIDELKYRASADNDIYLCVKNADGSTSHVINGYFKSIILDTDGATEIEIIRDNSANQPFEFLLVDVVADEISENVTKKLVVNEMGSTVNLDGTLSLRGAENISAVRNLAISSKTLVGRLLK